MTLPEIKNCPGTLAKGFNTYSNLSLKYFFGGRKVSHILPYYEPGNSEDSGIFIENRKRISVSGVQEKVSLLLENNKLRLTRDGEHGTYILKPIPRDLKKTNQVPANEHLTMQIAKQAYGILTAENALIFFKGGEPAYITKRFDLKKDGSNLGKEDFASLAGKSAEISGTDFKYEYSYEAMAGLIKKFVPAWKIEMEKFLALILFNYLFSNGDAHLKNFALLETSAGDHLLSPAYDLINTSIHVNDSDFALKDGLFENDYKSATLQRTNHPGQKDFMEFAYRIGIRETRADKIIKPFIQRNEMVKTLVESSFLNDQTKKTYLMNYNQRLRLLQSIR